MEAKLENIVKLKSGDMYVVSFIDSYCLAVYDINNDSYSGIVLTRLELLQLVEGLNGML